MCAVVQCSKHGAYLCMFVIPLGTRTDCPQLIAYQMGFHAHTHGASCRVHAPIHVLVLHVDGGDVRGGEGRGGGGGREGRGKRGRMGVRWEGWREGGREGRMKRGWKGGRDG